MILVIMASNATIIKLQLLPHGQDLTLPGFQTEDAAGIDLMAAIPSDAKFIINPGESKLVPTGISIELPSDFEAQVRPRSGLALKHCITVLNSPGTIDADYRGEIKVILINHGKTDFEVIRGARIAQLVIVQLPKVSFQEVSSLEPTERGASGFGSTGIN